jgi:hypothetical protein
VETLHAHPALAAALAALCFEADEYHLPGQPAWKLDAPLALLRPGRPAALVGGVSHGR